MALQYKLFHSRKFLYDHLRENVRPDGREYDMFRPLGINIGSVTKSVGSTVVRLGGTCIICGVRAELAQPRDDAKQKGYIIPHVDLSFLPVLNPNFAVAKDISDKINSFLQEILTDADCVNIKDLVIQNGKLVWVLHCDLIFVEQDGCLFDASILACFAALKNADLPQVTYNDSINKVKILSGTRKLGINYIPIVSTYAVLDDFLLTDPTFEEERLSSAIVHIGVSNEKLKFILKSGGSGISKEQLNSCISQTIKREVEVSKLLNFIKY